MKNTLSISRISIAVLLAFGLAACGKIGHTAPRLVASDDSSSQVMVPSGWKPHGDLNQEASIQVADLKNSGYLIVISEPKIDFDEITYKEHSELTRHGLLENVKKSRIVEGPLELMIQGRPAVQYEIHGSVNGIRVIYLHTTVDGVNAFHQILAWTTPSRMTKYRTALESVAQSFREIGL